ncbi:MAG: hypothetical protein ABJM06_01945 [Gilvibacter sp.]
MRNTVLTLLFFLAAHTLSAQSIIGTWEGDDGDQIGSIIFDNDGYCTFVVGNQVMGGKEFESDGKKGKMEYVIDESTTPIAITLTITKFATADEAESTSSMYGLIEFIDDDNIKMALGNPEQKVTEFTPNNSIALTRKDD